MPSRVIQSMTALATQCAPSHCPLVLPPLQVLEQAIVGHKSSSSCTCHGVSGSCAVSTCTESERECGESRLPSFREIGDRLKEKYSNSCQVRSNGRTGESFAWISQNCTLKDSLIHIARSPSHCRADSAYGTLGVVGRMCDNNSTGPGGCDNLCTSCGLIAEPQRRTVQVKCDCTFQYCCAIICNTCRETRTFYTCEHPRGGAQPSEERVIEGS